MADNNYVDGAKNLFLDGKTPSNPNADTNNVLVMYSQVCGCDDGGSGLFTLTGTSGATGILSLVGANTTNAIAASTAFDTDIDTTAINLVALINADLLTIGVTAEIFSTDGTTVYVKVNTTAEYAGDNLEMATPTGDIAFTQISPIQLG